MSLTVLNAYMSAVFHHHFSRFDPVSVTRIRVVIAAATLLLLPISVIVKLTHLPPYPRRLIQWLLFAQLLFHLGKRGHQRLFDRVLPYPQLWLRTRPRVMHHNLLFIHEHRLHVVFVVVETVRLDDRVVFASVVLRGGRMATVARLGPRVHHLDLLQLTELQAVV